MTLVSRLIFFTLVHLLYTDQVRLPHSYIAVTFGVGLRLLLFPQLIRFNKDHPTNGQPFHNSYFAFTRPSSRRLLRYPSLTDTILLVVLPTLSQMFFFLQRFSAPLVHRQLVVLIDFLLLAVVLQSSPSLELRNCETPSHFLFSNPPILFFCSRAGSINWLLCEYSAELSKYSASFQYEVYPLYCFSLYVKRKE